MAAAPRAAADALWRERIMPAARALERKEADIESHAQ